MKQTKSRRILALLLSLVMLVSLLPLQAFSEAELTDQTETSMEQTMETDVSDETTESDDPAADDEQTDENPVEEGDGDYEELHEESAPTDLDESESEEPDEPVQETVDETEYQEEQDTEPVTEPDVMPDPADEPELIQKALDACKESRLYISMNLSFACSMRLGEILGLPWHNVHISDEEIAADNAYVIVDRELERASWKAIQSLEKKDVYHIFEPTKEDAKTRVIIKKPKTESSIRKIWLPKTLAYMLRELQMSQTKLKEFLGDEYKDYGLVVAQENGHPCDGRVIEKLFKQLKEDAGLPNVVFHSLRHSSTTYKLKLNHGDLKATQGDTGHAEIDMITRVYAHILDEDRKVNAQKFESAFYANPDLREVRAPQEQQPKLDLENLLLQLQQSPELADMLANLLAQRAKTA